MPTDEGAEQVDAVRGGDLARECVGERWFAAGVDEQVRGGQGDERCDCLAVKGRVAGSQLDAAKFPGGQRYRLFDIREEVDDAVGDRDLTFGTVAMILPSSALASAVGTSPVSSSMRL